MMLSRSPWLCLTNPLPRHRVPTGAVFTAQKKKNINRKPPRPYGREDSRATQTCAKQTQDKETQITKQTSQDNHPKTCQSKTSNLTKRTKPQPKTQPNQQKRTEPSASNLAKVTKPQPRKPNPTKLTNHTNKKQKPHRTTQIKPQQGNQTQPRQPNLTKQNQTQPR